MGHRDASASLPRGIEGLSLTLRMLLLVCMLRPRTFHLRNINDPIPGVMYADEQQKERACTDGEERWRWGTIKEQCGQEQRDIGNERKCIMPDPIFEHWSVI